MRKLFIILLFVPSAIYAMDRNLADQLTQQAERLYDEGQHEQAAALYDSVLTQFVSADLYFNLANCHFKRNDLPRAILNYERAWKMEPGNEDIYHNLRTANRLVVDDLGSMPLVDLTNSWKRFQAGNHQDQWAYISLIAGLLGFGLLAGMLMVKGTWIKRSFFVLGLVALVICLSAIALAATRQKALNEKSQAIIFAPKVDVQSEPNSESTRLLILHEGSKVQLQQTKGDWAEVRLPNGTVGWIRMADVELI